MKKKYHQIKVNIPTEDYPDFKKFADNEKLTLAGLLRKSVGIDMAENNYKPKGFGLQKRNKDYNLSMIYHLAKIGTNLNQIAKLCNINKSIDRQALFALEKLYSELWEVTDDNQYG